MTPGLLLVDGYRCGIYIDSLPVGEGHGVCGRYEAGETLEPGRLVVLVDGRLFHATLPLAGIVGVVLAQRFVTYSIGELVPVLRNGAVTIAGDAGRDLEPARVASAGLFVASGGHVLARARYRDGGLIINR